MLGIDLRDHSAGLLGGDLHARVVDLFGGDIFARVAAGYRGVLCFVMLRVSAMFLVTFVCGLVVDHGVAWSVTYLLEWVYHLVLYPIILLFTLTLTLVKVDSAWSYLVFYVNF